jgi:hypothetical protein
LHDGKSIHVGCIGGHGRTGTVLTAIMAELTEKTDAIQWVRAHYCKKAVESEEQVDFLVKHYGVTTAKPTKTYSSSIDSGKFGFRSGKSNGKGSSGGGDFILTSSRRDDKPPDTKKIMPEGASGKSKTFAPMASARSLWRRKK